MSFSEDDFLRLSGLQRFSFCRRQWALIHVEQQWKEDQRTAKGALFHERAHDERLWERRGSWRLKDSVGTIAVAPRAGRVD